MPSNQVHCTHPDRDRVHLVPRPIPWLYNHSTERKKPFGLRNIAMVLVHKTSFVIGLATNAGYRTKAAGYLGQRSFDLAEAIIPKEFKTRSRLISF